MNRNPEEIREDIERTRGNLGEDVDAIADKVMPSNIAHRQSEKIKGSVRRAKEAVMGSVDEAGSALPEALHEAPRAMASQTRGNPLAAGLIAFGAGLLVSSLVPGSEKERDMVHTLKDKAEPVKTEISEAAKDIAQDMKQPAAEAMESLKDSARESAQTVKEVASNEASYLQDEASGAAANVKDSGGRTGPGVPPGDPAHRTGGI